MCQELQVSPSGYINGGGTRRIRRRADRAERIQPMMTAHQGRYGSPKITHVLRQEGDGIAQKTVARLMRELGLQACVDRRRPRSRPTAALVEVPNPLNQPLVAERPHPVGMAVITYCGTAVGWLF